MRHCSFSEAGIVLNLFSNSELRVLVKKLYRDDLIKLTHNVVYTGLKMLLFSQDFSFFFVCSNCMHACMQHWLDNHLLS